MEQFAYQVFLTPEEGGGFSTEIPDLPGCYSQGDDIKEAVEMPADAGKTYIAALMKDGESIPGATVREVTEGAGRPGCSSRQTHPTSWTALWSLPQRLPAS